MLIETYCVLFYVSYTFSYHVTTGEDKFVTHQCYLIVTE